MGVRRAGGASDAARRADNPRARSRPTVEMVGPVARGFDVTGSVRAGGRRRRASAVYHEAYEIRIGDWTAVVMKLVD